jgi:hypothetical protein
VGVVAALAVVLVAASSILLLRRIEPVMAVQDVAFAQERALAHIKDNILLARVRINIWARKPNQETLAPTLALIDDIERTDIQSARVAGADPQLLDQLTAGLATLRTDFERARVLRAERARLHAEVIEPLDASLRAGLELLRQGSADAPAVSGLDAASLHLVQARARFFRLRADHDPADADAAREELHQLATALRAAPVPPGAEAVRQRMLADIETYADAIGKCVSLTTEIEAGAGITAQTGQHLVNAIDAAQRDAQQANHARISEERASVHTTAVLLSVSGLVLATMVLAGVLSAVRGLRTARPKYPDSA